MSNPDKVSIRDSYVGGAVMLAGVGYPITGDGGVLLQMGPQFELTIGRSSGSHTAKIWWMPSLDMHTQTDSGGFRNGLGASIQAASLFPITSRLDLGPKVHVALGAMAEVDVLSGLPGVGVVGGVLF